MAAFIRVYLVFALSWVTYHSVSFPLSTNRSVPFEPKAPLQFCQYYGTASCDAAEDSKLQKQFDALNISDPQCASLMRSILCAKCDLYSFELFNAETALNIPTLCNFDVSGDPKQSNDFCTKVWNTCRNISIYNSPFFLQVQGEVETSFGPSKLIDAWQSTEDFCKVSGGSDQHDNTVCLNGKSAVFSSRKVPSPIKGICIEKIANGSYTNMAGHPDGSDYVFFANQAGKIWLASIPVKGLNGVLGIDESKPFLDISDRVLFQSNHGLFGMAFHPDYAKNGRFFVSFDCDKLQHSGCSGRCSCNTDADCDPVDLLAENGIMPCQYHNVIAEYNIKEDATNPSEARRTFTAGLSSPKGHAGQILFGPADGHLYSSVTIGSSRDEPHNFAQNKKSVLGKILRFDVDKIPSAAEVNGRNLWGNYSIPADNPYVDDRDLLPEIWAMGFKDAWRCGFDAERPLYFLCGDAGQDMYDEVDIIAKAGNYGWPMYEGRFLSDVGKSQQGSISLDSTQLVFPVMGYNHSEVGGSAASIIGGYFYRSKTAPCLYGRYLYTDVYAESIWVGTELPENSGKFTTVKVPYICAKDSPLTCNTMGDNPAAAIGYTFSIGEDNRTDIYILTSTGVYRVAALAHPRRCGFPCSTENKSGFAGQGPQSSSSSSSSLSSFSSSPYRRVLLLLDYLLFLAVSYTGCCLTGYHLNVSL